MSRPTLGWTVEGAVSYNAPQGRHTSREEPESLAGSMFRSAAMAMSCSPISFHGGQRRAPGSAQIVITKP